MLREMTRELRGQDLESRGSWKYSNLGAATAGQAVAAAAGMSYSDLMRTRLFEPLGMTHTAIQDSDALVTGGRGPRQGSEFSRGSRTHTPPPAPPSPRSQTWQSSPQHFWTAPHPAWLRCTQPRRRYRRTPRMGDFWAISTWQNGQTVTWHSGQTGGYASYFGVDRAHRRAVVVLSDVATGASTELGMNLLTLNG